MRVPRKLLKKISLKFSHSTVNNWLNKELGNPRKTKITFLLKRRDKEAFRLRGFGALGRSSPFRARKKFFQMVINKEIKGYNIFHM